MRTIYIDYNLVAIIGGRTRPNAEALENHVMQLVANGDQIALSAWHALELSRSSYEDSIGACLDLIDRLQPLWLSNPSYVKTEEIKKFLVTEMGNPDFLPHRNPALNTVISQMWATDGETFVGETFEHTVKALREDPGASETLNNAIAQTPNAILTGRQARTDGLLKDYESIIGREYFKGLVPHGAFSAIDYMVAHLDRVLEVCPAIAVENYLTRIRATEEFVPKESDAADLQHATVGVAYCDHFVSDDKMLVEHCQRTAKRVGVSCMVGRDLLDISIE